MTADPAARGPWHDVRNFCNWESPTTSRSIGPAPFWASRLPRPAGLPSQGLQRTPQSLAGTARNPRRPAARGPLTSAHARPLPDGLTPAHARSAAAPHASTHAPGPQRRAGSGAGGRAASGRAAGGGRGSRDRQPAPAP